MISIFNHHTVDEQPIIPNAMGDSGMLGDTPMPEHEPISQMESSKSRLLYYLALLMQCLCRGLKIESMLFGLRQMMTDWV